MFLLVAKLQFLTNTTTKESAKTSSAELITRENILLAQETRWK